MQIVDLFYKLAREHEVINAFIYGEGREKGAANEAHPLVWLDDPIHGQSDGDNVLRYTANLDILGIPTTKEMCYQFKAPLLLLDWNLKRR